MALNRVARSLHACGKISGSVGEWSSRVIEEPSVDVMLGFAGSLDSRISWIANRLPPLVVRVLHMPPQARWYEP